jgi:signal transduction histidine kinase
MSGTASPAEPEPTEAQARRRPWQLLFDAGFLALTLGLLVAMWDWRGYETVPYHLIFVLVAAVYGFRVWSPLRTAVVLGVLIVLTGAIYVVRYRQAYLGATELSELVTLPMVMAVMAWHARRRMSLQAAVERLVTREREWRLREHEFLHDASHALRTPLTVTRGYLELIRESVTDEAVKGDAQVAMQECDRMQRLAARLISITDLERPDSMVTTTVDVAELVRQAERRWQVAVPRRWSQQTSARGTEVIGNAERLGAALDALIENSVRLTQPGDPIRLVGLLEGHEVVLGVADAGPGLPDGGTALMFERFWRHARHESDTGSGLGLALVKAVADAHGGRVFAEAAPEGGAYIGTRLPVAIESPSPEFAAEQVPAARVAFRPAPLTEQTIS